MVPDQNWISISDLGQIYGVSAIHCARALQNQGLQNHLGQPTSEAFKRGIATNIQKEEYSLSTLWNVQICQELFKEIGYKPINKSIQIEQWAKLLEALEEGSPSINTTADQMAEELPDDLILDVNHELASRGCRFQVKENTENTSRCRSKVGIGK